MNAQPIKTLIFLLILESLTPSDNYGSDSRSSTTVYTLGTIPTNVRGAPSRLLLNLFRTNVYTLREGKAITNAATWRFLTKNSNINDNLYSSLYILTTGGG